MSSIEPFRAMSSLDRFLFKAATPPQATFVSRSGARRPRRGLPQHDAVAPRPSERATDARAFISVEIEACPLVLAMGVGIFLATLPPPARRETPAVPGLRIAFAISG